MKQLAPASTAARDLASGRYRIRRMTVEEVDRIAIAWMREAGWNPGLHAAATFHAADPEGFLMGLLEGEPIACLSAVAYGDHFGSFGCYIVRADPRGGGYGVLENVAIYEQIGRRFAYRNARFEGPAEAAPSTASDWFAAAAPAGRSDRSSPPWQRPPAPSTTPSRPASRSVTASTSTFPNPTRRPVRWSPATASARSSPLLACIPARLHSSVSTGSTA